MGRYDDRDIFKKLNKEKPLVKQMDTKASGITVKRMDISGRTQEKKPPEIFPTRTAPGRGNEPPRRTFKEFGLKPAQQELPGLKREAPRQTDESGPALYHELPGESKRTGAAAQQPEPSFERPQHERPQYRRPQYEPLLQKEERTPVLPKREETAAAPPQREMPPAAYPKRPAREEPSIYAEPKKAKPPENRGTYGAEKAVHAASRYDMAAEQQKKPRQYRHELKYYINARDYEMLRSAISGLLLPDAHARSGGYHIRSLYFDDYENSAMQEKINGVKGRKKYRIRIYNKSMSFIRLERKVKTGDFVSKDSMPLSMEEYSAIIEGDIDFLLDKKNPLAHDLFVEMRLKGLRPVAVVDYYREAYEYGVEDVRITFDSDLRSSLFEKDIFVQDMQTMPMYENGLIVLEVKYNRYLPHFIKVILNNAEYTSRSAISKYLICRKYE